MICSVSPANDQNALNRHPISVRLSAPLNLEPHEASPMTSAETTINWQRLSICQFVCESVSLLTLCGWVSTRRVHFRRHTP